MKSNHFILVLFTLFSWNLNAQEWNSLAPNTLHAENGANNVKPIFVGIGTNAPTAALHTDGPLRFQNLGSTQQVSSLLGTLSNGDVRLIDPREFEGNGWQLDGNDNVTSDEFIGTLNAQDFRIVTNDRQKMVVTTGGRIGINSTTNQSFHTPIKLVDARFQNASTYNATENALDGIFLYNRNLNSQAIDEGVSITFAGVGGSSANQATAIISGVVTGNDKMDLVFQNEYDEPVQIRESMRITSDGFVGIGTDAPEVQLHTTGQVQLDGIPAGTGCLLALDDNNRVVLTSTCVLPAQEGGKLRNHDLQKEITALEDRLARLETLLDEYVEASSTGSVELPATSKATLLQNAPNPFTAATNISLFIPQEVASAELHITDQVGKVSKIIKVEERGKTVLEILNTELSAGTYFYTLITDGVVIGTKKMVSIAAH